MKFEYMPSRKISSQVVGWVGPSINFIEESLFLSCGVTTAWIHAIGSLRPCSTTFSWFILLWFPGTSEPRLILPAFNKAGCCNDLYLLDLRCFSWASLGTWIWFSGIQQIELLLLSFQLQFHSVFEIYILVPQFVTIGTIQLASREPTTWCAALTSTGQVGHTKKWHQQQLRPLWIDSQHSPKFTTSTVAGLRGRYSVFNFPQSTIFTGWEIVALISRVESGNQHTCKPHKHGSCNVQFDFPWNPWSTQFWRYWCNCGHRNGFMSSWPVSEYGQYRNQVAMANIAFIGSALVSICSDCLRSVEENQSRFSLLLESSWRWRSLPCTAGTSNWHVELKVFRPERQDYGDKQWTEHDSWLCIRIAFFSRRRRWPSSTWAWSNQRPMGPPQYLGACKHASFPQHEQWDIHATYKAEIKGDWTRWCNRFSKYGRTCWKRVAREWHGSGSQPSYCTLRTVGFWNVRSTEVWAKTLHFKRRQQGFERYPESAADVLQATQTGLTADTVRPFRSLVSSAFRELHEVARAQQRWGAADRYQAVAAAYTDGWLFTSFRVYQ